MPQPPAFDQADLLSRISTLSDSDFDALDYGVIGFDTHTRVQRYSRWEEQASGLSREQVLGQPLFSDVAQCFNNFLVAQRFEDAQALGTPLDTTLDFVLTLRMRPTDVRLRLLWAPGQDLRHVLIQRQR